MSRFTPLLKKQIGTLSSQLIIVLTSLLTIVVVTRSLGLDSFGRVGLVGSIVGTIGVILQLGMGASLNRYLSAESSAEKQDQLFTNVLIIRLLILLPVIILLTQFSNMLLELVFSRSDLGSILQIALVMLLTAEITLLFDVYFVAIGKVYIALSISTFLAITRLLMFSSWSGLSEVDYFTIMILSSFLGACISLVVFKLILGRSFRSTNLNKIYETIAIIKRMSAVSSGTKIVYAFWDQLPVLLLANHVSDAVMGQIVLALRLSERFRGIGTSLAKVNMAHLTKKLKQEGASAHAKEFKSNFSILTMLFGFVLIVTYLLSDFIIVLVGGPEFSGAGVYLIYTMTMAYLFLQINWIGSGVLYASDSIEGLARFHFITKIISLLLIIVTFERQNNPLHIFSLMCLTEALSIVYYAYRSRRASVPPMGLNVITLYTVVMITFYLVASI